MRPKLATLALAPVLAAGWAAGATAETREMSAHVHGHGSLSIALEGDRLWLALRAPGADIVGFEHPAESEEDKAAIAAALARLARPLDLFRFPEAAGCAATEVEAEHEQDEDGHDDEHAEHDDEHKDEHDDEQAEHEDEHKDEHADEHAEDDGERHSEFHAEYLLTCAAPEAADRIELNYFALFPNALELEVKAVTGTGAHVFEIGRDDPVLDLSGKL